MKTIIFILVFFSISANANLCEGWQVFNIFTNVDNQWIDYNLSHYQPEIICQELTRADVISEGKRLIDEYHSCAKKNNSYLQPEITPFEPRSLFAQLTDRTYKKCVSNTFPISPWSWRSVIFITDQNPELFSLYFIKEAYE